MRRRLSLGLQIVGACSLSVGGFLVTPWLGCVIVGLCCVLFGVALERD